LVINDFCIFFLADELVPVTYKDLLVFITGADTVPLLGLTKKIEVMFFSQEPGVCRLPHASTCGLQIWLLRRADALSDIAVRAIKRHIERRVRPPSIR